MNNVVSSPELGEQPYQNILANNSFVNLKVASGLL